MKVLEKIFRRLLWESQLSGDELAAKIPARVEKAVSIGLAIYVEGTNIILYDPRPIVNKMASIDWRKIQWKSRSSASALVGEIMYEASLNACIGMISADSSDLDDTGPCNGAAVVSLAASRQGYGPMIYDIAMHFAQVRGGTGMTPDRQSVTPEAEELWKGMFRRPDIEKSEFVPYKPGTPRRVEPNACVLHPPSRPSLNYSYKKSSNIDPAPLVKRHEDIIEIIRSMMPTERAASDSIFEFKDSLLMAADSLFKDKYNLSRRS